MWKPTLPPMETALLYRLEENIKEAIPLLNQCIAANADTAYIMSRKEFGPVDASCVGIGDMPVLPPAKGGVFQFRVCSGAADWNQGACVYSTRAFMSGGMEDSFMTSIYGTMHQAAFRNEDSTEQSRARAICQSLICGWMRARVLNFVGVNLSGVEVNYQTLEVASQEKWPDGIFKADGTQKTDQLGEAQMASASPGVFTRDYGANGGVYGLHFLHTCKER